MVRVEVIEMPEYCSVGMLKDLPMEQLSKSLARVSNGLGTLRDKDYILKKVDLLSPGELPIVMRQLRAIKAFE